MAEMYGIYKDLLFQELKGRINAGIFVDISDDTLTVKIVNDGITWACSISNIAKMISLGCSVDRIVNKVVTEYKKEIMRRYFY